MLTATTLVWLLGISAFQVAGGFVIGWWLRSFRTTDVGAADALAKRAGEILGRVQRLAGNVSADASQHAQQVQAATRRIQAVAAGGVVDQVQHTLLDGISQILEANDRLQSQLSEVEQKLEEQSRQIETQLAEARIDSLTGIANRRALDEELSRRFAEFRRRHSPMSLLLVDIDHFKKINDRYGHATGDAVLREAARVLHHTMREMDFTARFGGEEFAIVLPATVLADARRAAVRALKAISSHVFEQNGREIGVTISLGLAEVMPSDDAESLLRRADEALYLSKAAGRNCGHFHTGSDFLLLESPRLVEKAEPAKAEASAVAVSPTSPANDSAAETKAHDVETSADNGSDVDSLTGLPNGRSFSAELRRRVPRARAEDRPLSLVLVDVDHLAEINARGGRAAGDAVLCRVAKVLNQALRPDDYAARYHEGQFALVLDAARSVDAVRAAERIRGALQQALDEADDSTGATVSCGVAEAEAGDRSVSLVMRASRALAAAKSAGRDNVFVHDGRTAEPAEEIAAG